VRQQLPSISNPEHQVSSLINVTTKTDSTVKCGGIYWGDEPKSDDIMGDDNCRSTMPFDHFKLVEECVCTFWQYVGPAQVFDISIHACECGSKLTGRQHAGMYRHHARR
jgi:hypothetical protein